MIFLFRDIVFLFYIHEKDADEGYILFSAIEAHSKRLTNTIAKASSDKKLSSENSPHINAIEKKHSSIQTQDLLQFRTRDYSDKKILTKF